MATQTTTFKTGTASFQLRGKLKFTPNTFTLNKKSDKGFISNQMNLGVDCGHENVVYARMFDGFFDVDQESRQKNLYVHGKKEDPNAPGRMIDDWENQFMIPWSQRFSQSSLEQLGPSCFIRIGLRYNTNKELVVRRYLSAYDAIADVAEFVDSLSDERKTEIVADVSGNLEYEYYDGRVICRKTINRIVLAPNASEDEFYAKFSQTVYMDKESIGKPDLEKKIIPVTVKIPSYVGKYNGVDIKKVIPLNYEMQLDATCAVAKWAVDQVKSNAGYSRFTFKGVFIESGSAEDFDVTTLDAETQSLLAAGVITEDEVKMQVAAGNQRKQIMRIVSLKMLNKLPNWLASAYTQKEMDALGEPFYRVLASENKPAEKPVVVDDVDPTDDDDMPFDVGDSSDDNMDWLTNFAV